MRKTTGLLLILIFTAGCLSHHVPRPKSDVDFTYKIGWWPYQDGLTVQTLSTEVVDSTLNLFNSTTLIRIKIKGSIQYRNRWEPKIEKVHIAEEVVVGGNFTNSLATIRLQPIIGVKENDNYAGDPMPYDLTQELHIHSMGWGSNTFHIICAGITNKVNLMQMK